MSADDLGRRLLAEIEEASLSEILADLSELVYADWHEPRPCTGVKSLDKFIALFHSPVSQQQYVVSPGLGNNNPPPPRSFRQGQPCVEVLSPEAGAGKTQLLYYLIAIAILPASINGLPVGGQQSAVLYFQCEGDFRIERLVAVIEHHVSRCAARFSAGGLASPVPSQADLDMTIEHALDHVHIFSPQSIASFTATVESLPEYLYDPTRHKSMHRRIHSVMLDSVSAFYWADRNDIEDSTIPSTVEEIGQMKPKAESGYTGLRASLTTLCQELRCPVIYTVANLFHTTSHRQPRTLPSSMPKSWLSFPTVRLIMQRRDVRGFPLATSAEEAAVNARDRHEAMSEGKFTVFINEDNSEEWPTEVRNEMDNGISDRIMVQITDEGVMVEG